jgi:hypothetical protein
VSDYRPDDQDLIFQRQRIFSSLCVHTVSDVHPVAYPMGTGGPFAGGKARPRRDADNSPHLVPKSRMSRSCTFSPQSPYMACSETTLRYFTLSDYFNYMYFSTFCNKDVFLGAILDFLFILYGQF